MSSKTPKASDARTELAPKRKKIVALFLLVLAAAFVGAMIWLWAKPNQAIAPEPMPKDQSSQSSIAYRTTTLQVGERRFDLDVADTSQLQTLGLGKRQSLAADHGMVFVYDTASIRCFWMKDMNFAIDIIWLDSENVVNHIEKSVSPDTYPQEFCPPTAGRYVVELQAGMADTAGIKLGDKLSLEL